jgi:hypothetical protein
MTETAISSLDKKDLTSEHLGSPKDITQLSTLKTRQISSTHIEASENHSAEQRATG